MATRPSYRSYMFVRTTTASGRSCIWRVAGLLSVLLALGAACSIVLASPGVLPGMDAQAPDKAAEQAQATPASGPAAPAKALQRSPESGHGPLLRPTAPRKAPERALTRPADPLTRRVHAHVAQYGGDLDVLTQVDMPASE